MTCDQFAIHLDEKEAWPDGVDQGALEAHMAQCPACAALNQELEDCLYAFKAAEPPLGRPGAIEGIIAQVAAEHRPVGQLLPFPEKGRQAEDGPRGRADGVHAGANPPPITESANRVSATRRPAWTQRWGGGVALFAAALALFIVLPEGEQGEAPLASGTRDKGQVSSLFESSVDLQVAVEGPGGAYLRPLERDDRLSPDDGLIFRFMVEGAGHLRLIERDPHHQMRVVWDREVEGGGSEVQRIEITSPVTGKSLRYMPDGAPGRYTYLALLTPEDWEAAPNLFDGVWNAHAAQEMGDDPDGVWVFDSVTVAFEERP